MDATAQFVGGVAGLAAALVNTAVGSGALVALPLLVVRDIDPRAAVIALSVGLLPGTVSGTWAYRRELVTAGRRAWLLALAAALGGALGAGLLMLMPSAVFAGVVPWFILSGAVLMALQPRISASFGRSAYALPDRLTPLLFVLLGVYGALLGAGQGLLTLALLAMLGSGLQAANAVKNLTNAATNLVAAILLVLRAEIPWALCAGIAVGAVAGGLVGARVARRLPDRVLRGAVVVTGLGTAVWAFLAW